MKDSVAIIANPRSGASDESKLARAMDLVRATGGNPVLMRTERPLHAWELAAEAAGSGASLVVAAGGDGTFNEVLNGLAGTGVPLAVLPTGTTNVIARELGLPGGVDGAMQAALTRKPREVNLGHISIQNGGRPIERKFCLMAGAGFDAAVVHGVDLGLKGLAGKLAYIVKGFQILVSWEPAPLRVTVDGRGYECYTAIVSNSRKYAGNFDLAPEADITVPDFHVYMLESPERIELLKLAAGMLTETHHHLRHVRHEVGSEVEISGNAHVQIEGDYLGTAPARIRAEPGALRLVY